MGLNPSWRNAISEVFVAALWREGSTADFIFQQIDQLKKSTLILDQLTTDSGSYLNEVKEKKIESINELNCSYFFPAPGHVGFPA